MDPREYLITNRINQVIKKRLVFSHPIYGEYIINRVSTAFLLDTFEFKRLHYIKQANLQYLVRPSATHSRLAHVIGSLSLLRKVLDNIYFNVRRYLSKEIAINIIYSIKRYEKHMELALLLHDIGAPPFSHVLEPLLGYMPIKKYLKVESEKINHEIISLRLIDGRNDDRIVCAYNKFFNNGLLREMGLSPVNEKLKELSEENLRKYAQKVVNDSKIGEFIKNNSVSQEDMQIVKYFINPNPRFFENISEDSDKSLLMTLSNLINGLFDVDRIEHLMSDIYYTGFSAFRYDFSKIISGYIVIKDYTGEYKLGIIEDMLPHFMSFLMTRIELKRDIWNDYNVRGYEVMLQHAVKYAIDNNDTFKEFFAWTDDYLMHMLVKEVFGNGAKLGKQLLWRSQMYELVEEVNILDIVKNKYDKFSISDSKIQEIRNNLNKIGRKLRDLLAKRLSQELLYYLSELYTDAPCLYVPPKDPEDYVEQATHIFVFDPKEGKCKNLHKHVYVRPFLDNFNLLELENWKVRMYVPQFLKDDTKKILGGMLENDINDII